jgi:hypothetical protein
MERKMSISKHIFGAGIAGAMAISAALPATAAPVPTNTAAIKGAASEQVTEVHWRAGPAIAAGAIAGFALGAAIASQPRYYGPGYYYAPGYYYGPPADYYGYGYSYTPSRDHWYGGRVDTNGAQYSY